MSRDDFSKLTKSTLAQRAGYLCSICNIITIGPSSESDTSVNLTGIAAHITAASPGGRRYDKNLTPEERSSIENGIWLCSTHADLIDGDEIIYTTPNLKSIKQNHEYKIRLKQSGVNAEKGVVTKIEISNIGLITKSVSIEFSDRNIIKGKNTVGKTLIMDMISSLYDKASLDKWVKYRKKKVNTFCEIDYFKNQVDKFLISIDKDNKITYLFNDTVIPFLVPTVMVIYPKNNYDDFAYNLIKKEGEKSLVHLMSRYFNLKENEFINVIGTIMRGKKYFFNDIILNAETDELIVNLKTKKSDSMLPFEVLSGGEKARVILEITLKIAHYYSKFNSTILLIEKTSFGSLDSSGVNHLFDIIRNEKPNYQFFFTTIEDKDYDTTGFNIYELIQNDDGEIIVK